MVKLSPSQSILGTQPPSARPSLWVSAHGDVDDHLRITALLASALGTATKKGPLVEACLNPRSPWAMRREALRDLLADAKPMDSGFVAGIVDPDLLFEGDMSPEVAWDDRNFGRERTELFRLLVQGAERGGWVFLRTAPQRGASAEMEGLGEVLDAPVALERDRYTDALAVLSPAVRPVCRALVKQGVLTQARAMASIRASGKAADEEIIATAYDQLPRSVREAARRIALVRPAQPVNGVLGPFAIVEEHPGEQEVGRAALDRLRTLELLQPGIASKTLRMPVAVRRFLARRTPWTADVSKEQHLWLARGLSDHKDPAIVTEAHYHAIMGGELDLACRTARFYGADLRSLAFRLSDEGKYLEAAKLYQRIVESFDDRDAYAWEYLGFNLARAMGDTAKVEGAYKKAVDLAPTNPLYQGRYLGYRAEHGQDVGNEIVAALHLYQTAHNETAISFFGKPVISGLRKAKKVKLASELLKRWPTMDSHTHTATA